MTTPIHRVVRVGRRRTSVRFADELFEALDDIADREGLTRSRLFAFHRLSKSDDVEALRLYALGYCGAACTEEGHRKASHGTVPSVLPRLPIDPAAPAVTDDPKVFLMASNGRTNER
jgi:predicted DNA-binding ribbon-helix-helix protein